MTIQVYLPRANKSFTFCRRLSGKKQFVCEPWYNGSSTYLCSQIWDADELLEDVLGQDVGVSRLLDVIRWHVDVVGSEMEVGGRYGPEEGEDRGTLKPNQMETKNGDCQITDLLQQTKIVCKKPNSQHTWLATRSWRRRSGSRSWRWWRWWSRHRACWQFGSVLP